MSTWIDSKLEQARRQLIKHGRLWTIYDEELNDEENEFISEAPDLLSDALDEIDRLRAALEAASNTKEN